MKILRPGLGRYWAITLGMLILAALYPISLHSYLLFHCLVEIFSIVIAFGIFLVAWNSRQFLKTDYLLFVGIGYLFVAGLDLLHTLAYKGMGVFPGYDANLPTQLWIATRYLQSGSLLIAPIFLERKVRLSLLFAILSLISLSILASIFYWGIFPDCFVEGKGLTSFKKTSEYLISLILLGALGLLTRHRAGLPRRVFVLIAWSIGTTIGSELAFIFYVSVYGLSNLVGHFFKVIATYLMYKAIVETGLREPYELLFRELVVERDSLGREVADRKKAEEALTKARDELEQRVDERTAELSALNKELAQDITGRKRAEETLHQAAEEIRDLYNHAPCGYHSLDKDGVFVRMNETELAWLGYRREEVIGQMKFTDLLTTSSLKTFEENFPRFKASGAVRDLEFELIRKDGSILPVLVSATSVTDSDGYYLMSRSTVYDISERKRREQERLANLKFFESMDKVNRAIQGARDVDSMMSDVLDVVLAILDCDRAFLMYPCDPEATTWRAPKERNKPEYPGVLALGLEMPMAEAVAETLRILLSSDGPVKFGPGTPYPVPEDVSEQFQFKCFMSMALHPKVGKPWQFGIHQCSYARIWTPEEEKFLQETGRRLADALTGLLMQRNLQESENRYRRITESLTDYQYSVLIENGRAVETKQSTACAMVTGYTSDEFAADPYLWISMIPLDDRELVRERIQQVLAGNEIPPIEHRISRKDGTMCWVSDTIILFKDASGKLLSYDGVIKDITERKLAEEALQIAAVKYRIVADNTYVWEFWSSPTGEFIYISPSCKRITGYEADEFQADPGLMERIVHQDDRSRLADHRHDIVQTMGHEELEYRIVRPDGTIHWIDHVCQPVFDEKGNFMGTRGSNRDITERKLTEEKLHRLNRELRAISNCNQVLVRAADEQTLHNDICRIICDEAGYRMVWVGYAEHDEAKTIRAVAWAGAEDGYLEQARFTWADTERGRGPAGTSIRSGESACIQDFTTDPQAAPWRDSALQRGYRSSIALPLKDECADTFGVLNIYSTEPNTFTAEEKSLLEELSSDLAFGIVVLRTRAERKRAEEKNLRLAEIVESSDDAIIGKTLDGIITSWNKGAENIYGYKDTEAVGKPIFLLVPPDRQDEVSKFLEGIKRGGQVEHHETVRRKKDGREIDVSLTISPIKNDEGRIIGASTIARDITQRKRADVELRQYRERLEDLVRDRTEELERRTQQLETANIRLREADRLKSVFLASMSHELRTPLNSIIGFTGVMLMGMTGELSDEQKKQLTMVKNSANHLLGLINDVLDISKIEAGSVRLVLEQFDLADAVDSVIETLSPMAAQKGLDLVQDVSTGLTLTSDKRRIKQILINLMGNAIKFTDHGTVKFSARIVDSGKLELRFTDTGTGIRQEDMNKLFFPFQQIDDSLTKAREGTGLGLYLCKRLVSLLGGDIRVSSTHGKGSEFTVVLPLESGDVHEKDSGC